MIYLDNAATTKPDNVCLKCAEQYISEKFYNPSALYAEGYNLHRELISARSDLLNLVANDRDFSLNFTSCGTEADNQAVFCGGRRGNVVTTMGEHSAVYSAVNELKERGIEVRFASLNGDGSVDIPSLLKLIDGQTSLVSLIHVNNETGAINDINVIAKAVKSINPRVLFHSDGVQAFGKIPFKLSDYIDLYSISAHKIGGLKGTGALIKRKSLVLKPLIYGGGQEGGLRSGTENVFGIKTFEFAAKKRYENIEENLHRVKALNGILRERLDKSLFKFISPENGSPYILCVAAVGVRGEIILHEVNDKGLIIGTGSACSSNSKKRYSRIILSCGIDEGTADGVLRLSFSPENTSEEVERAADILNETVKRRKEIMN
ncbi:MAG: cysteine desulfurase [Clostridiales bacterium]|nr:cysteine desulfurase [Clostridiales bacterium]